MASKKKTKERWFKLGSHIFEKHETPKDNTVMRWFVQVVRAQQYEILPILKVGNHKNFTLSTILDSLGDCIGPNDGEST